MKWARVLTRATLGDFHLSSAHQGLTRQEDLAHSPRFEGVITTFWLTRLQGQRLSPVSSQQFGTFIHADLRIARVVGTRVHLKHILHAPEKSCAVLRGDASGTFQPRFYMFFLPSVATI